MKNTKNMKVMSDLDYVALYSENLKNNNKLFEQQKMLIQSQMKASSSLFRNSFGSNFKQEARKYLRGIGVIHKDKF